MASEDESLVYEGLRRGLIDEEEARRRLGMTHVTKPEDRTFGEDVEGLVKSAGTGIANAVTGFAGLPGEVQEWMRHLPESKTFGKFEPKIPLPTRPDIKEAIGDVTGMSLYEPQTMGEKYAAAGAEGAVSFMNPLNPLAKVGPAFGLATGLMGEGGAQAMQDNPLGRLYGQSPAFVAAMLTAFKRPQQVKAAQESLKLVGERGIAEAAAKAEGAAKTVGAPSILAQGSDAPVFSDMMKIAQSQPKGAKIQDILKAQKELSEAQVREMAEGMATRGLDQADVNKVVEAAANRGLVYKGEDPLEMLANMGNVERSKGPLGQMFSQGTMASGTGSLKSMVERLDNMTGADVKKLSRHLSVADPEAFSTVAKASFKRKIEAGIGEENSLKAIPKALRGPKGTEQAARFEAIVEEGARAAGIDPAEAVRSANAWMDALETLSTQREKVSLAKPMGEAAESTMVGGFLKSVGLWAPLHSIGRGMDRINYGRVADKFIEALTAGDGGKLLIEMANFNHKAAIARRAARGAAGIGVSEQGR